MALAPFRTSTALGSVFDDPPNAKPSGVILTPPSLSRRRFRTMYCRPVEPAAEQITLLTYLPKGPPRFLDIASTRIHHQRGIKFSSSRLHEGTPSDL
jgi:hypothetical protein